MSEYKKISEEELIKTIEQVFEDNKKGFQWIVYTVDKKDGRLKLLEETEQFDDYMKEYIKNEKDKSR